MDPAPADPNASIVCRVTPWYFKRRAMMAALFAFFGAYFLYDGSVGYPKQVEIAKRNAELEKAIADLRRSYEAAENEKKLVREQLAEAKSQLDALRAGGGTLGAVKANEPFVYSGPTITGKVEEVTNDSATGAMLAKISVGSNDNIRDNMKLAIRRDNEFVGNLVILKTDLKFAIGKIDLLGRSVAVQVGDVVQSNLQ